MRGPAHSADTSGGQPGGEANRMIVGAGQHRVRRDQSEAGVGAHGGPPPQKDGWERLPGDGPGQRAPATVAGGWTDGGVPGAGHAHKLGEPPGCVAAESSIEIVFSVHSRAFLCSGDTTRHRCRALVRPSPRRYGRAGSSSGRGQPLMQDGVAPSYCQYDK